MRILSRRDAVRRFSKGQVGKIVARAIIVIHDLEDARAACKAASLSGTAILLRSADGAAAYAGAGWFHELIRIVKEEFSDIDLAASIDCADAPGLALAALRQGIKLVRYRGSDATAAKIADIAAQCGAGLDREEGPVLDLLDVEDRANACRVFLAHGGPCDSG